MRGMMLPSRIDSSRSFWSSGDVPAGMAAISASKQLEIFQQALHVWRGVGGAAQQESRAHEQFAAPLSADPFRRRPDFMSARTEMRNISASARCSMAVDLDCAMCATESSAASGEPRAASGVTTVAGALQRPTPMPIGALPQCRRLPALSS